MKVDQYATFVRMNVATMNYTRMAAAINCTWEQVRDWCIANNCARPPSWQPLSDDDKQFIRDNWRSMSDDAMAQQLGRSSKTGVQAFRQGEGLKRGNPNKGFQSWRAGQAKRAMEAPASKDIIDLAAEHVARHDGVPVYRIDANGQLASRGDLWRYGTARWSSEYLMEKAIKKKFDPSIYRVAA